MTKKINFINFTKNQRIKNQGCAIFKNKLPQEANVSHKVMWPQASLRLLLFRVC